MDAVAERAGVSKATIYRWWPTKETLALDMLYNEWTKVTPQQYESGIAPPRPARAAAARGAGWPAAGPTAGWWPRC